MWSYNYSCSTELYHHGVKGQKWGVRRYQNADGTYTSDGKTHYGLKYGVKKKYYKDYMDEDRIISKGSEFQNISANKARDIDANNPVYTSHTEHDNNAYAGSYANHINFFKGEGSAIKNTLVTIKDVKVASQKKAVETFMDLYKSDPKGISDAIAKAYADLDYGHAIPKFRDWNANRLSKKNAI